MKKFYTLALICCTVIQLSFAQSLEYTVILDERMHELVDMIPISSGNFILAANNSFTFTIIISALTPEGEILWSKEYYGELPVNAKIFQKSNGNLLIPMERGYPHIMEVNQEGDSLRSVTLNEHWGSYFGSVIEMPDLKLMATELIHNNDPYFPAIIGSRFIKLSPELNVIEKYPVQNFEFRDMIAQSDSTMITVVFDGSQSVNFAILQYTFAPQQLAWTNCPEVDPDLNKIIKLNDDYLAAIGRTDNAGLDEAVILKIDNAVDQQFCNTYSNWSFYDITCDIETELIYALGSETSQYNISTIDYSGNLIAKHPIPDTLTGHTILFMDDYLYLTAGYDHNNYPRLCLIKMHRDSVLAVDDRQIQNRINVYPVPAKDKVVFDLGFYKPGNQNPEIEETDHRIRITNFVGQEVTKLAIESNKVIWDCSNQKPGIYFYSYNLKGRKISGKIVVTN